MAGASASVKGKAGERQAAKLLCELAGDLVAAIQPGRLLGEGRELDRGDLEVFSDVTIQVKNYGATWQTQLRASAVGAERQRINAGTALAFGLVKVPGVLGSSVKWLAAATVWPDSPEVFFTARRVGEVVDVVRDDRFTAERAARVGVVEDAEGQTLLYVAPVEAWVVSYRQYRTGLAQAPARHRAAA